MPSLEPMWRREERSDSQKLASDCHVCIQTLGYAVRMPIHTHRLINKIKQNQKQNQQ